MLKSIISRLALVVAIIPALSFAQDTLVVEWSATPGHLESTIMGDTTSDGAQAHSVYVLEANKVYLQLSEVNLYTSCSIVGAEPGDGEHPATVQPCLAMMVHPSSQAGRRTISKHMAITKLTNSKIC